MTELVLSGYKELWPKNDQQALYLGPWCFVDNFKYHFSSYENFRLLSSPWIDDNRILEAAEYINSLFERILPHLAKILNEYYNTNFDNKFWKISSITWLIHWLGLIYERYCRLTHLMNVSEFNRVSVKILNDQPNMRVVDDSQLNDLYNNHAYNLYLFSELIRNLKSDFFVYEEIDRKIQKELPIPTSKLNHTSYIKNFIDKLIPEDIYFGTVYGLTYVEKIKLKLNRLGNNFSFMRIANNLKKLCDSNRKIIYPKNNLRNKKLGFTFKNEFEEIIDNLLIKHLPVKMLDYIPSLSFNENKKYWFGFDIYKSQDTAFKIARIVNSGGKWINIQHGGGYGQIKSFPNSKIEYDSADYFITWGWSHKHLHKTKLSPLPVLQFNTFKRNNNVPENIIMVGTNHPLYFYRLHTTLQPEQALSYIKNKLIFLRKLMPEILSKILYKPYFKDYGTGEKELLSGILSEDQFISPKRNVSSYLGSSCLNVIDHLATTYLESLAMNIPTVIFWQPEHFSVMDSIKEDFEKLAEVGIYHSSPVSAAKHINEIYLDIEGWWQSEEVQKKRIAFTRKYAFTDTSSFSKWKNFIKQLK